jgi:co-chaperonin GroES (HSP10)
MNEFNYTPTADGILVNPIAISKTTEAGLVKSEAMIKEESEARDYTTEVVAVGPQVREIVAGDTIVLGNGANCMPIKVKGQEYWQVKSYEVMGIMK